MSIVYAINLAPYLCERPCILSINFTVNCYVELRIIDLHANVFCCSGKSHWWYMRMFVVAAQELNCRYFAYVPYRHVPAHVKTLISLDNAQRWLSRLTCFEKTTTTRLNILDCGQLGVVRRILLRLRREPLRQMYCNDWQYVMLWDHRFIYTSDRMASVIILLTFISAFIELNQLVVHTLWDSTHALGCKYVTYALSDYVDAVVQPGLPMYKCILLAEIGSHII